MFWHLYRYRLKILFKNKYLLFWLGAFPFILGTLFHVTFSNIAEQTEKISAINVVLTVDKDSDKSAEEIVDSDEAFGTFVKTMVDEGYFKVSYSDYDGALKNLEDEKTDGALILKAGDGNRVEDISIVFAGTGMNQTILKNIINTYKQGETVIEDTMINNPQALNSVIAQLYSDVKVNKELSINAKNMNTYNQYFFALFSMTCMFGAYYGMVNTAQSQADQTPVAVRRCVSPTKKMMTVLTEYLAAVTVVEFLFVLLWLYLTLILGINLGDRYGLIMAASVASSFLGVALGYFIGVILKCKHSAKEGIMTALVLFLNFLAGLMVGNMKFIMEKLCPIVNRINPAALISDCFYSICAYDDTTLYTRCMISIGIWTVVLAVASITILRREKYANL